VEVAQGDLLAGVAVLRGGTCQALKTDRCLIRTRRMAELTPFLRAPLLDEADLAINEKSSDNNEVRPRFSGR